MCNDLRAPPQKGHAMDPSLVLIFIFGGLTVKTGSGTQGITGRKLFADKCPVMGSSD